MTSLYAESLGHITLCNRCRPSKNMESILKLTLACTGLTYRISGHLQVGIDFTMSQFESAQGGPIALFITKYNKIAEMNTPRTSTASQQTKPDLMTIAERQLRK